MIFKALFLRVFLACLSKPLISHVAVWKVIIDPLRCTKNARQKEALDVLKMKNDENTDSWTRTEVSELFWVLPQNIFVYNNISRLDLKVRKTELIAFKIVAYAMIISLAY
jgi:hypothetical protein